MNSLSGPIISNSTHLVFEIEGTDGRTISIPKTCILKGGQLNKRWKAKVDSIYTVHRLNKSNISYTVTEFACINEGYGQDNFNIRVKMTSVQGNIYPGRAWFYFKDVRRTPKGFEVPSKLIMPALIDAALKNTPKRKGALYYLEVPEVFGGGQVVITR